jgi:hypothetical protein
MYKMSLIIKISDKTKEELQSLREYPRETWDDLIQKILKEKFKGGKKK